MVSNIIVLLIVILQISYCINEYLDLDYDEVKFDDQMRKRSKKLEPKIGHTVVAQSGIDPDEMIKNISRPLDSFDDITKGMFSKGKRSRESKDKVSMYALGKAEKEEPKPVMFGPRPRKMFGRMNRPRLTKIKKDKIRAYGDDADSSY